jgi:hypothetical protein
MRPAVKLFQNDEDVLEVVRRFESCVLQPGEFNHRPHLVVALCYVRQFSEAEARELMRRSILRFLAHHRLDASVYHETLTVFWIKRVRFFLDGANNNRALFALANDLIEECGDSRLVHDFYSAQLIASEAARRQWIEPDLKPLIF